MCYKCDTLPLSLLYTLVYSKGPELCYQVSHYLNNLNTYYEGLSHPYFLSMQLSFLSGINIPLATTSVKVVP